VSKPLDEVVQIIIPSIGRPCLVALLESIAESARSTGLVAPQITVVDDRPTKSVVRSPVLQSVPADLSLRVLRSHGRGPAAARNVGWRSSTLDWIAFLDDDVVVESDWLTDLDVDLRQASKVLAVPVGGIQGRLTVPLPAHRRPTDWERGTAGLQSARWITADMVYMRQVLARNGGFDERFPRAFREDADLALRVLDDGYALIEGRRRSLHPVRAAGWWASVAQQRGNADDVLMRRKHGSDWRRRARSPLGRRPGHLAITASGLVAVAAATSGRRGIGAAAALGWLGLTTEFAWRRIAGGPRDRTEIAKMITTSVAIPPIATYHWLRAAAGRREPRVLLPAAVLLDRDGTIVEDVPYNGNPALVAPMPGALGALDRLREAGIPIAVISNQSGIGRGLLTTESVAAVNARVEELLGPFAGWFVCPHTAAEGCACRKPMPGLIHQAAQQLGVDPQRCVVIGDIGSDVGSAAAAGARSILIPTPQTLPDEVVAAPVLAENIGAAIELVLAGKC